MEINNVIEAKKFCKCKWLEPETFKRLEIVEES